MSGICGEIRFDDRPADAALLGRLASAQAHRGPDAAGVLTQDRLGFGHRRLAVIDPSPASHQPLVDADLGLGIVYDGALYNFREIRRDLEDRGYRFFSAGDAEVVLKAYHAWGTECLERFHGMFAFAVWERDSGRVVLARDRAGVRPLYYARMPHALYFCSHLPALLGVEGVDTSIDTTALHHYLTFHAVVPFPRTILTGIEKLPPASVMVIEPDGSTTTRTYWSLSYGGLPEDAERDEADWQQSVLDTLRRSVKRRLVADVPVGVLLSGGLDSSLIVGLLAEAGQDNLATYSIGFEGVNEEKGDEFTYSDQIAQRFGTDHHRIFIDEERLLPALPGAIEAMAEPMVSHDAVAFYLLSQEVSRDLKVVQSGQGADEVFGGYRWYPPLLESADPFSDYAREFFDRDQEEMSRLLKVLPSGGDVSRDFVVGHFAQPGATAAVDKAMRLDTLVMAVEDPIKRVDNMTMAWGLQARMPFLDHEILELAARMPASLKVAHGGKHVLKEAARQVIPASVIDRPKGYFPVPALKHLQGALLEMVGDVMTSRACRERALFKPAYVDELMANPQDHITPLQGSKLWQLALLELWLQTHGL